MNGTIKEGEIPSYTKAKQASETRRISKTLRGVRGHYKQGDVTSKSFQIRPKGKSERRPEINQRRGDIWNKSGSPSFVTGGRGSKRTKTIASKLAWAEICVEYKRGGERLFP